MTAGLREQIRGSKVEWPGTVVASCPGCQVEERFDFGHAKLPALDEFRLKHLACGPAIVRIPSGAAGQDMGLIGIHEWRLPQSGKRGGRRQ